MRKQIDNTVDLIKPKAKQLEEIGIKQHGMGEANARNGSI